MIAELVGMGGLLLLLLTPRQRLPRQSRQRPAYKDCGLRIDCDPDLGGASAEGNDAGTGATVAFWLIGVFRRKGVTL